MIDSSTDAVDDGDVGRDCDSLHVFAQFIGLRNVLLFSVADYGEEHRRRTSSVLTLGHRNCKRQTTEIIIVIIPQERQQNKNHPP